MLQLDQAKIQTIKRVWHGLNPRSCTYLATELELAINNPWWAMRYSIDLRDGAICDHDKICRSARSYWSWDSQGSVQLEMGPGICIVARHPWSGVSRFTKSVHRLNMNKIMAIARSALMRAIGRRGMKMQCATGYSSRWFDATALKPGKCLWKPMICRLVHVVQISRGQRW